MDLELGGKVCVVTGASKGIGLAVTRPLVAEGAVVVAGAREFGEEELDDLYRKNKKFVPSLSLEEMREQEV